MPLVRTIDLEITGDFTDPVWVWQQFLDMLNEIGGIAILATVKHDFPGGGLSGIVIIGESHAAIHTWPERGLAWVELATCGDPASLPAFALACQGAFRRDWHVPGVPQQPNGVSEPGSVPGHPSPRLDEPGSSLDEPGSSLDEPGSSLGGGASCAGGRRGPLGDWGPPHTHTWMHILDG